MTREAECIMHPALSAILSIQPSVLDEIMSNTTMTGRGLIARFLYASPPSRIGSRVFRTQPIPPEVIAAYRSLIFRLMALPIGGDAQTVHLSEKAFDLMADYFQEHRSFWLARGRQFPIGQANISVPYSGLRDCCTVLIWKMTKQK